MTRAAAPPRIEQLAPDVIAHIAAGETVDRPVAVLKELLENSLDAGSSEIAVQVDGGLDRSLRILDNGGGIEAEDLPLAFTRHATSKLRAATDLDAIHTLGFRGEALPSIAQVARVTLTTRTRAAEHGTQVLVEGGVWQGATPIARAPGTTVWVEDLFFNVPARRKFLKTAQYEVRLAARLLTAYALALPELRVSLTHDGRALLDVAPVADVRMRLGALYGPQFAAQALEVRGGHHGIRVEGMIGAPEGARATREHQYLFVNGRPVQNAVLSYLVRRGYGTMMPDGRHPFFVLSLSLPPELVDVNVHPTKREVRFARESDVSSAIVRAVDDALRVLVRPFSVVPGLPQTGAAPAPDEQPEWITPDPAATGGAGEAGATTRLRILGVEDLPLEARQTSLADDLYAPLFPRGPLTLGGSVADAHRGAPVEPGTARAPGDTPAPGTPFWQLHDTWVFAPVKSGFIILDQHAAHERIMYEQIRDRLRETAAPSQTLLFPEVVELTAAEYDTLLAMHAPLERLGFDIRALSGNTVVVRGIPADCRGWTGGMFLRDLLEDTEQLEAGEPSSLDALAASYACHSVIRANQSLRVEEMGALIDALFRAQHPESCPHGRPTFVRIGLDELEKRFGRR